VLRGLKEKLPRVGLDRDLIVGLNQPDDAAVYRLGGGRVLIATVDFFTPIVDDPYDYGRIAATNSMSDVFAMGGDPFLALSVAAFPDALAPSVLTEILHGAAEQVRQAGAVLAGGHTVRDPEPKFGLCVLGFGEEHTLFTKAGARPGDAIYLSKPLGTGILSTAVKLHRLAPEQLAIAVDWMTTLSSSVSRAARAVGVRAATDVTGFSLAGHALEMARAGQVKFCFDWKQIPILEGTREAAESGAIPGGGKTNQASFEAHVEGIQQLSPIERAILFDPQTSGGLLLAVPADRAAEFERESAGLRAPVWRIGDVEHGAGLQVRSAT
jgi:selenide,water dikinase